MSFASKLKKRFLDQVNTDMTLLFSHGNSIKCHRLVLSCCDSDFLQALANDTSESEVKMADGHDRDAFFAVLYYVYDIDSKDNDDDAPKIDMSNVREVIRVALSCNVPRAITQALAALQSYVSVETCPGVLKYCLEQKELAAHCAALVEHCYGIIANHTEKITSLAKIIQPAADSSAIPLTDWTLDILDVLFRSGKGFRAGDTVQALWKGKFKTYRAEIVKLHNNGTYDVKYED